MTGKSTSFVSVVVPCYNEEAVLEMFFERVAPVIAELESYTFEFLFVDDGSTDGTSKILARYAVADPRVKVITLSRNFGHQQAIFAGLDASSGEHIIILDADLQDPPEYIPQMLAALHTGYDLVHMVRSDRSVDSFVKRITAKLFYQVIRRHDLKHLPYDAGDFKGFTRQVLLAARTYRERINFLRGVFATVGFKQTEIPYVRDPRTAGKSKYSWSAMLRLATDALFSYSYLPSRWLLSVGLLALIGLGAYWAVLAALVLSGTQAIDLKYVVGISLLTGFSGLILIGLGIMGEYLGRIFLETKQRPPYLIQSVQNLPETILRPPTRV